MYFFSWGKPSENNSKDQKRSMNPLCLSASLNKSWHLLSKHVNALSPNKKKAGFQTESNSGTVTKTQIKFSALRQVWNLNSDHLQMSTVCDRQHFSTLERTLGYLVSWYCCKGRKAHGNKPTRHNSAGLIPLKEGEILTDAFTVSLPSLTHPLNTLNGLS